MFQVSYCATADRSGGTVPSCGCSSSSYLQRPHSAPDCTGHYSRAARCGLPASLSHFSSRGLSLHMFLKLRLSASKREMVVWLKSLPYSFPMASPTSPCQGNQTDRVAEKTHSQPPTLASAHARSFLHWQCLQILGPLA